MARIGIDTFVLSPVTVKGGVVELVERSFSIWEASLAMTESCMLSCLGG